MATATERRTFDSLDPATGEVVGTHVIHDEAAVAAAVERAETGGALVGRARLRRAPAAPARCARCSPAASASSPTWCTAENGKPLDDARRRDRRRRSSTSPGRPATPAGCSARAGSAPAARRRALGPPGVPAARRGRRDRAVELPGASPRWARSPTRSPPATRWCSSRASTPRRSASWLADAFAEVVPEHPVLQVVHGLGDVGAALCRAGVDKIAFTGSTATGKRVMAACAETLTPVVLECGGKDAMIVDADADLDAAADAARLGRPAQRRPDLRRRRARLRRPSRSTTRSSREVAERAAGCAPATRLSARSPCPARST